MADNPFEKLIAGIILFAIYWVLNGVVSGIILKLIDLK